MDDKLSNLNTIPSIDRTTDLLYVVDMPNEVSYKVTPNQALGFTGGNPVSTTDTQTLTNKTLTSPTINTPTLTVNDNALTIQDNVDTTKKVLFELSGITAGQTRTLTIPDASTTLVGTGVTQTLTNKTLTAPTITNPTLTVDTISEFTSNNGVTIDGLNIKDSAIATANSVPNSVLSNTGSFSSNWAWTAYVPTISASAGTITATTINLARYTQIGKRVSVRVDVTIVTVGTGSGLLYITLPVNALDTSNAGCASETAVAGVPGNVYTNTVSRIALTKADGTTGIIVNYRWRVSIEYEVA